MRVHRGRHCVTPLVSTLLPSDVEPLNLDFFFSTEFFRVLEKQGKKKSPILWSSVLDSKKMLRFNKKPFPFFSAS